LEGEAAIAITGKAEAFTVRPEKIAMVEPGAEVHPDDCTATGNVREVVYLGAVTRYIVSLDVGSTLVVLQQNLTTSSMEALQVQGKAVRLVWRADSNRHVEAPAGADDGSIDPGEETA
jgi:putative spermidine/putrescine transport system ATP-binding protein